MTIESDIVVAGTGPAGLLAALAISQNGFRVALVGPDVNLGDGRTTALMKPQLDFLDSLGLLDAIRTDAAPLKTMRIVDGTSRLLRSPIVSFRATEIGEDYFGLNIPNRHMLRVLSDALERSEVVRVKGLVKTWSPGAEHIEAELLDGSVLRAKLAIAADGRNSPARDAVGIKVRSTPSQQSALVLNFEHTRSHQDTSCEFHTEHGPFTQVPLPGQRSSLVWVNRPHRAQELASLDEQALSRLIEDRMQSMLGRVTVDTGRQVFPLSSALPQRFAKDRVALIGEAAHVFPPIGAQGLNLGIRDIEGLAEVTMRYPADPGGADALAAYDRVRRPDIVARSSAVNLLNRSLLSDMLPTQAARSLGLSLLERTPPLRALFMREGLRTGSGVGSLFRG